MTSYMAKKNQVERKWFLVDADGVTTATWGAFGRGPGQLDTPALIYPLTYVDTNSIPYEKVYNLWVIHMYTQIQAYFKYLSRLLRYA